MILLSGGNCLKRILIVILELFIIVFLVVINIDQHKLYDSVLERQDYYRYSNNKQLEMTNYVLENMDNILSFSKYMKDNYNEVISSNDGNVYYDHTKVELFLKKYGLNYFSDDGHPADVNAYVSINDDKLIFIYDNKVFDGDDIAVFSFYVQDGKIIINDYNLDGNNKPV